MNYTSLATVFCLIASSCALGPSAEAQGSDGARLALFKPSNQWMSQGGTNRITVIVERTGFSDDVDVKFLSLPKGVRVDSATIPENDSSKEFTLVASPDAEVVTNHPVTIEVQSHGLTTSQTFQLSVKAK